MAYSLIQTPSTAGGRKWRDDHNQSSLSASRLSAIGKDVAYKSSSYDKWASLRMHGTDYTHLVQYPATPPSIRALAQRKHSTSHLMFRVNKPKRHKKTISRGSLAEGIGLQEPKTPRQ